MKTDLENLLFNGVDEKLRRIYLGHPNQDPESHGDIDMASISFTVRAIHKLASDNPKKPIELHVNSYGGDAYSMIALLDVILACPCQVQFFGSGAVMSSAAWIMAVCDVRYLHEKTTVLLHDGFDRFEGKNTDIKIEADEAFRIQTMLEQVLADNSRMPSNFWHETLKRDVYLTAQEALSLGICDQIIQPKKRGNLRKIRQYALENGPSKNRLLKLVRSIYDRIGLPSRGKDITVSVPKDEIDETISVEEDLTQITPEKLVDVETDT